VSNDSRIESISADLSKPARAIEATAGADVLYHCVNVPYHRQVELMPGIAEAILAAANAHRAKLVVLDTLYPYGDADGDAITERTPWAATTRKGRLRADLDRRYLYSWGTHEARVALGRSADFFGPRVLNSTLGGAFFPAVLTGQPAIGFGDLTLAHSYSYIPDVARGLIKLGSTDRGDGRIWHLPTTPAVSTREIHAIVARLVGHELDVHVLDRAEPVGPFDATFMAEYAEMFYQHRIPQNMVSTRFEQHFGIGPTPLETALAATIEWYRNWLAEQSGRAS
jgi:nucleoside-diphosphate-sugar epimerase